MSSFWQKYSKREPGGRVSARPASRRRQAAKQDHEWIGPSPHAKAASRTASE